MAGILIIVLIAISLSAVLVYQNLQIIVSEITEEARPDEALILMKGMLYDISDAENSVKSYSLTRDPEYLNQFNTKSSNALEKIEELQILTSETPERAIYIDTLNDLLESKFTGLEDLLIVQDQYRSTNSFDRVLQNVERSTEESTNTGSDTTKNNFFDKLFKRRKEDKGNTSNTNENTNDEELVSIEALDKQVNLAKREQENFNNELRIRELELIQQDKQIMDHITQIIDLLEKEEALSLKEKIELAESQSTKTKWTIALFCIICGILLLGAGLAIYRYVRRNDAYKKALHEAKNESDAKNKEILDSIQYARRIQAAILPDDAKVKNALPRSFVLYKPKDIVAGDFYWLVTLGERTLVAVADCTGHGVPGAMVSVVCYNALNRSVREFGLYEPADILEKCRELVVESFDEGNYVVNDGMDIALCSINLKTKEVSYSGANNSLYILKNGQIQEIKADKQPVGRYMKVKSFTNHKIQLSKGDRLYMATDGYADQFGGPKQKKFKYKAFKELLEKSAELDPAAQKDQIDRSFENWKGQHEQVDDVCVIGIDL